MAKANKNNPYFNDFVTLASFSCQAAEYLHASLKDFLPSTLSDRRKAMHEIEHSADVVRHELAARLVKEFVAPIDREDIKNLADQLDDVTDKIEDVLIRMYMYNVQTVHPRAVDFADIIVRCCNTMYRAMTEFANFKKSSAFRDIVIEVNTLEEEGDALYINSMHDMYAGGGDRMEILVWSELFDRLEDCCDACEHVADLLELIAMKNS